MNDLILHLINGAAGESAVLDAAMKIAATDMIYLAVPLLAFLWLSPARPEERPFNQRAAVTIVLATLAALAIGSLVGRIYWESRPFVADARVIDLVPHAPDNSFPSHHAAVAFAIAGALSWSRRQIGAFALAAAATIALARVFVGVHWPIDVVAGATIGLLCGSLAALAAPLLVHPQRKLAAILPAMLADSPDT